MHQDQKVGTCLDHLVVGVGELNGGAETFERFSGLRVPTGGRHPLMGTHNCLTQLGNGAFLELIAIDPAATAPERKRWYSLDEADTQQRLMTGPTLLTWVVAVPDLDAALSLARQAGFDAGRAVEQQRDDLHWRLTVRDDGRSVAHGTFPTLIQWPEGVDAAERMPDQGARVQHVQISNPDPTGFATALDAIGAGELVEVVKGPAALTVQLLINERRVEMGSNRPVLF